ncbi:MAG TPA: hypothetical protein VK864_15385, partial [Longimicrobiales bacterium]|nr:hypothetical protein [Longimicrobiales bacterium]
MSASRRSLPSHPDFEHQKKLAKELLRAFRNGDTEARARIREQLPDKRSITLADAQFVLAREYGFASWSGLKKHIESSAATPLPMEELRSALQRGDAQKLRRLLERHAELRALIDEPLLPFDTPALVHFADREDPAVID